MQRGKNYIAGQWVDPSNGRWRPVLDPSTGETFAEIADSGAADGDAAVAAAKAAFETGPWPRLSPEERRGYLLRLAEILVPQAGELSELIARDAGCPIRVTEFMQVATPIGHLEDFANQALLMKPVALPVVHDPSFAQSEIHREPVGVCAGFTPFNFPLFMSIWKVGGAIAMGNSVVVKPSPLAPLAANALAQACEDAGIPPGVVNVVHGDVEVGERLASHPNVDMVSFTGSTAVGRRVMEMAAGTIKKVVLELGGKSPAVVLDDADIELAVRGTIFGFLLHAGQGCVCTTRMLVPRSRADEVVDLLLERVAAVQVGSAMEFSSDMGPLISAAQLDKVERYVTSAVDQGAKVAIGGNRLTDRGGGFYFEPTVLVGVTPDMNVACEEVFGPVLSVIPYDDDDDAIRIANDSDYGLAAAVWGNDLRRAREIGTRLRAGTVWINDFGQVSANGPFGGYKQSGLGRELSPEGTLEYTELKHLYTALDRDLDRRPYSLVGMDWD